MDKVTENPIENQTERISLDRMKEFPDYKFTSGCAAYY